MEWAVVDREVHIYARHGLAQRLLGRPGGASGADSRSHVRGVLGGAGRCQVGREDCTRASGLGVRLLPWPLPNERRQWEILFLRAGQVWLLVVFLAD